MSGRNPQQHQQRRNNVLRPHIFILLVSLLCCIFPLNSAFAPHSSSPWTRLASMSRDGAPHNSKIHHHAVVKPRGVVGLFASGPEQEPKNRNDGDDGTPKTPVQVLKDGVYLFFNYCSTFIGVALTGGIVLNLCGYGYVFSKEEGLRIDTIDKLREENQFRRVSRQYAREYYAASSSEKEGMVSTQQSEAQPPTSLPR